MLRYYLLYAKLVSVLILLAVIVASSLPLCAQDNGAAGKDANATQTAQKDAGAAKKKAGLLGKIFKKFSKEAKQAKKLEKETSDSLQVFGWHVYWLDSTLNNYNYNALSTLSFYACIMTGSDTRLSYTAPRWGGMSTSRMIALAKADNCTVTLTLKSADQNALTYLLDNPAAQQENINYILYLIDTVQHADGVTVFFENLPNSRAAELTLYIKSLSTKLKLNGKYVSLVLPGIDFANQYDINALAPYVSQFIVQGHDLHDNKSNQAGPVAPLDGGRKWGSLDIIRSVNSYLRAGLPKHKFILALPYYGALWRIDSLRNGKTKHVFVKHRQYNQILDRLNDEQSQYDSTSHSMIGRFVDNGKTYLYFYENEKTLGYKYAWVKRQGLAGVAIWALGFDDGHDELWQQITKHVDVVKLPTNDSQIINSSPTDTTSTPQPSTDPISTHDSENTPAVTADKNQPIVKRPDTTAPPTPSFFEKHEAVFSNTRILIVGGVTLIIFIVLGVIKSLFYPEVYSRLLIGDIVTYIKATITFILIFAALLITTKLIFQDALLSDEMVQFDTGLRLYDHIIKTLWLSGAIAWLSIQILSAKAFLRLNSDLP